MWKPNLEETKKHYIDWWNHKGIVLNMWEHFQEGVKPHADVPMPPAPKSLDQKWFDPEWRAEYLDWYVAHSSMKADMLPVANTQLGPGSLAAILGGVFEGGEDTIWIHPDPNYTDDIKFDINDPANKNWQLHKDLLRACKKKAKGNYYVGMPDLMEGMDVLAAMKGTDKVLLDTVTQPEVLERQMQQINDIYFKVFDELYDIIREGDEMAFCYFSSWAPGKMTKLQSDISTMISVEDYRRFVQPFIRQQCQKIDYTLYHLDGVGAMHHLPALLEIEELNAIQWTPGVGEPQGGSPKWYDLYKKILAAGKSIMACWVTLDELRPLLDNIGGNGVHIEMDFHNEDEVEKALRIVEEYQESADEPKADDNTIRINKTMTPDEEVMAIIDKIEGEDANAASAVDDKMKALPLKAATLGRPSMDAVAKERIFVLDGATGTTIQQYKLTEEEFRGERFKDFDGEVRGTNDLLALTYPEIVTSVYRRFLEAGSDLITTNTFNSQRISLGDKHLQDYAREINLAAARLARKEADAYTLMNPRKPRYVLGDVGPTSKTLSIGESAEFNEDILHDAYYEQIEALIDGGVDAVLIETIFDIENAKVALRCCKEVMLKKGFRLPIMMSFTVASEDGHNMLGQSVVDFVKSLNDDSVFSVGLNCSLNAAKMAPIIQRMAAETDYYISMFPNAGLPDEHGHYLDTPKMMQAEVWPIVEAHLLNVVGGCCGTDDLHIREIAKLVQPIEGLFISPHYPGGGGNARLPGDSRLSSVSRFSSDSRNSSLSRNASTPVKEEKCSCGIDHDAAHTSAPSASAAPAATSASAAPSAPSASAANDVFEAILAGKGDKAADATKRALDEGLAPQDIINGQMIRAMSEVGQRFQDGKAFVPQLLMAGRAMKTALEILKPLLAGQASTTLGRIVIGTVKGDLHDIGKNLVASMLEGCGFEVKNIGIDVPSEKFVEAVKDFNADILCMSALLTTTMTYMRDVIKALEDAGIRNDVKVMVGGAPVTQTFADEIGADGYSDNANSAVAKAKELMKK